MSISILGRIDRLAHLRPEARELRITGFQSPAEDDKEACLSLDALTGLGSPHIWVVVVEDEALMGFGLYTGDYLVVDRSYRLTLGNEPKCRARLVVVDLSDGAGYRVRLITHNGHERLVLRAADRFTPDMDIETDETVEVFGVITWTLGNLG